MSKNKEITSACPAVDIYENDDGFLIVADMPGVKAGDLSIHLDHPTLTVEGRQGAGRPEPLLFERSFSVPETVEAEGIDAKIEDGVLSIVLRKSEASKPRKIEVAAG
jgi:HSP20 family molecular chaperone IbpA